MRRRIAWLVALVGAAVVTAPGMSLAQETRVLVEGLPDADGATRLVETADGAHIDAGTVNAAGTRAPRSGRFVRWTRQRGGFLVWTLRATVEHGFSTARFAIAPEAQGSELRYALGSTTRWTGPGSGSPLVGGVPAVLNAAMQSGEAIVFQVAMPMRSEDLAGQREAKLHYQVLPNGSAPRLAPRAQSVADAIVHQRPFAPMRRQSRLPGLDVPRR